MTKKFLLVVIVIVVSLSTTGLCWEQSFRHAASGNLFYGDFDNDLDPIFIWDNEGYRVYTTLSNLSTTNDKFFSNITDGVFLFSTSGQFGIPTPYDWQGRTMLLFQLADARTDLASGLDTDYDGVIDVVGSGFMSGDFTQYFDNNDDNIFDTRVNVHSTADNFDRLKKLDWNITHSYRIGDKKAGLSLRHLGFGNNYSEDNRYSGYFTFLAPAQNFSYSQNFIQTDLSTQNTIEERREAGDFKTTYKTPATSATLSFEMPFSTIENSELRFNFDLSILEDQFNIDDSLGHFRDVSGGGVTDININNEYVKIDSSLGGNYFSPGCLLTKHWNSDAYSWFEIGFGFGSFNADKTFLNQYNNEIQLTDVFGNVNVTTRNYNENTIRDGSLKRKDFRLYHKTITKFSENFSFAAGLGFNWRSDKTSYIENYTFADLGTFDNGDDVNDHNDSTFSILGSYSADIENVARTTVVNLPIAIEYSLGRWTFRLGAIHTIQRLLIEESRLITESSPVVTTIAYGDGDIMVTVSDDEFLSLRTAKEQRTHQSQFIYGLELKALENLKVEFLAFMSNAGIDFINTDFCRELRLSLTVIF